jgi:hypothetical protein
MESEIRILDRLEKRVSKLEQALLKRQADEYVEPQPTPEPFKVPEINIQPGGAGTWRIESFDGLIVQNGVLPKSDLGKFWQAIAHTCEMAKRARTIFTDPFRDEAIRDNPVFGNQRKRIENDWVHDFDAEPVKP